MQDNLHITPGDDDVYHLDVMLRAGPNLGLRSRMLHHQLHLQLRLLNAERGASARQCRLGATAAGARDD